LIDCIVFIVTDIDSDVDQSESKRSCFWTAVGRFPQCPLFTDRLDTTYQRVGST